MASGVLKSHLADVHVHNDVQKISFGYWENWGDCQICDLDSVTKCVLKSHLPDELELQYCFFISSKRDLCVYLWEQSNYKSCLNYAKIDLPGTNIRGCLEMTFAGSFWFYCCDLVFVVLTQWQVVSWSVTQLMYMLIMVFKT